MKLRIGDIVIDLDKKREQLAEEFYDKVEEKVEDTMYWAEAGVKNWWESKVNVVQFFGALGAVTAMFGFELTPEIQSWLVSLILVIQGVFTFVFRTWFTKDLVWNSVDEIVYEEDVE